MILRLCSAQIAREAATYMKVALGFQNTLECRLQSSITYCLKLNKLVSETLAMLIEVFRKDSLSKTQVCTSHKAF